MTKLTERNAVQRTRMAAGMRKSVFTGVMVFACAMLAACDLDETGYVDEGIDGIEEIDGIAGEREDDDVDLGVLEEGGRPVMNEDVGVLGNCTGPLCSEIENPSTAAVFIAHDWCDGVGPCPDRPQQNYWNDYDWLPSGRDTPSNEDWDTFRVDAGWCYRFRMYGADHIVYRTYTYDRRGLGAVWIKVRDDQTARIMFQSSSTCG